MSNFVDLLPEPYRNDLKEKDLTPEQAEKIAIQFLEVLELSKNITEDQIGAIMGVIQSTIVARKLKTKEDLIENLDALVFAFEQILEILCLED
jgi:hypothetical protein